MYFQFYKLTQLLSSTSKLCLHKHTHYRNNESRCSKSTCLVFQIQVRIFSFTLCLIETPLRFSFWEALGPTNLLKGNYISV